ncbi:other 1 protein kinase [Favolaschia claudopus]|uniref:Other 1 protein kinase n=1 Tax=Favolaschia claudopus TaxID=2862362 RepID=A0AAW0BS83_9AGAR
MCPGYDLELEDGWILALGKIITSKHGKTLVTQATITGCPRSQLNGQNIIVKWSWVSPDRTFEADIIASARRLAEEDCPKMLLHLPEIYHSQQCDGLVLPCRCQEILHGNSEDRILRVMIQKELKPIQELEHPDMLAQAFKAIFGSHRHPGYRWLYEKAHIMHRDISVANLMFHEVDGKMYGVLNDFDHALDFGKKSVPASKQRTGTKPFMAIDLLLEPPEHLYRHDLESFLYVLVFLTCETKQPFLKHPKDETTLQQWAELAMLDLYYRKNAAITEGAFPPCKHGFDGFKVSITYLASLFGLGFGRRIMHGAEVRMAALRGTSVANFDDGTLGGAVTFDEFAACFKATTVPLMAHHIIVQPPQNPSNPSSRRLPRSRASLGSAKRFNIPGNYYITLYNNL